MNKNSLKKLKKLSSEFNDVAQDFEKKLGMDEESLKNWLYKKHEEIGELLTHE